MFNLIEGSTSWKRVPWVWVWAASSRRIKNEHTTHGSMRSLTEINASNFIIFYSEMSRELWRRSRNDCDAENLKNTNI